MSLLWALLHMLYQIVSVFGNPEKPHQMWEFVEAVKGVSDACKGVQLKEHPESPTPIIAGNVSFL